MNHEEELIRAFILPKKRARYRSLINNSKRRDTFLFELDHFKDFDPRFANRIPPNNQTAERIESILKNKKAPMMCHVISSNKEIDNQEMLLAEALDKVVGNGCGTFISCIPGRLAYFESEEINERYILERS